MNFKTDPHKSVLENWKDSPFSLKEALKESNDSHEKIFQLIYELLINSSKTLEYAKSNVRKKAEEFLRTEEKMDANKFSLFLIIWARTSVTCGEKNEAEKLISSLKRIKQKSLMPEIVSFGLNIEGFYYSMLGNKIEREKLFIRTLKVPALSLTHKQFHWMYYSGFLACHGRMREGSSWLKKLFPDKMNSGILRLMDSLNALINYINMFDEENALKHCKLINQSNSSDMKTLELISNAKQKDMLLQYFNYWKDDQALLVEMEATNIGEKPMYMYIVILSLLFQSKAKEALVLARRIVNEYPLTMISYNLNIYGLVRAELANLNTQAALKLLLKKIQLGDSNYFDDFFFAKIYFLEGNETKAGESFGRLMNSCKWYGALKRLDFELGLSCELTRADIFKLSTLGQAHKHLKYNKKIHHSEIVNQIPEDKLLEGVSRLKGNSKEIDVIRKEVIKYSKIGNIVLITGETGVGKEVVAKAIHEESDRKKEPFLAINCGAIVDSLLQSELYGHAAGAYTGAQKLHKGIFESAGKGTIFLDEVGDISPLLQVSLLRVLECGEFRPIGSAKSKPYHCRIVLATNKNLSEMIEQNLFRRDLYFRMNSLQIKIPPLKSRKIDIRYLAKYFHGLRRSEKETPILSEELLNAMENYSWPGNVRELKNEVERMRMLNSDKLKYDLVDFSLMNKKNLIKDIVNAPSKAEINEGVIDKDSSAQVTLAKIDDFEEKIISEEKTPMRRLDRIKTFFIKHKKLTRGEIIKILKVAPGTVTSDLKKLEKEGFIIRVCPSASTRSHYFELKS